MSDTKADNSKDAAVQTLLHYLVRVLLKTAPMLLDFKNELPHLQAAAKCKPVSSHVLLLHFHMLIPLLFNHSISRIAPCNCEHAECRSDADGTRNSLQFSKEIGHSNRSIHGCYGGDLNKPGLVGWRFPKEHVLTFVTHYRTSFWMQNPSCHKQPP